MPLTLESLLHVSWVDLAQNGKIPAPNNDMEKENDEMLVKL